MYQHPKITLAKKKKKDVTFMVPYIQCQKHPFKNL